jgi:flagellar biogenesis protein FliO
MEADVTSQAISPRADPAALINNFLLWVRRAVKSRRMRRLRVCETLSLGDRRFLAVVEFDHQEFLVGGSGNSLSLLARMRDGMIVTESSLPQESRAI